MLSFVHPSFNLCLPCFRWPPCCAVSVQAISPTLSYAHSFLLGASNGHHQQLTFRQQLCYVSIDACNKQQCIQTLLHSQMLPTTHVIHACIHLSSRWPGPAYADCRCICNSIVVSFVCDRVFVESHWLSLDLCWVAWRGALKQAL